MFLSRLSFCFFSLFSQIGRYGMLFNCISSNLWISYSFSVDQNKTPPQSFHISFTLFYVCYLKMKGFFPSLPYGGNNRYSASTGFSRETVSESSTWKFNRNIYFKIASRIAKVTCYTSPLRLLHPKAFILSIYVNKTSQGLFLGTGANCPAARIETAKPFHLPRTRCLQPNYYWGWPLASVSPQMVPRHCLEKH